MSARWMLTLTLVTSSFACVACSRSPSTTGPAEGAASSTTPLLASALAAPPSGPARGSASVTSATPAGAQDEVSVTWKATNGPDATVRVSLVVGDETYAIGSLDATSDDGESTVAACKIVRAAATGVRSRFQCGGTPAYNFFTATLTAGALVVTRTEGVEHGERGERETTKTVKTIPTSATTLDVRPLVRGNVAKLSPPAAARVAKADSETCVTDPHGDARKRARAEIEGRTAADRIVLDDSVVPDLDGDKEKDLIVMDVYSGTRNALHLLYLSNSGCRRFAGSFWASEESDVLAQARSLARGK